MVNHPKLLCFYVNKKNDKKVKSDIAGALLENVQNS